MPRTVNADEARACAYAPAHVSPGEVVDLAHTIVAQAEQIAAVLALCSERESFNFPHPMLTTEAVRRALGATA